MRGSILMRGRQRVALLARRLHSHFALPGWQLDALRWPTEEAGELLARGPAGASVAVRFTLGASGNRSQLGVDFHTTHGTDQTAAKTVITEVAALLRASRSAPSPAAP
jgi:hypothetical protein